MKTPQEIKAEELVEKFAKHARYWDCYNDVPLEENHAVECAKIAVKEIIDGNFADGYNHQYWHSVLEYLNKM